MDLMPYNIFVHVIIGSNNKNKSRETWIYIMFLKVAGKLHKLDKNVVHRYCSSKSVFSSRRVISRGDRLPGLSFAIEPFNKRFYNTTIRLASERKSSDFWHKVNSKNKVNEMNPHYLVESFLQSYSDRELAKSNINLDLINRIMCLHIPDFSLTLKDFNILKSIKPIILNYPFEISLPLLLGKSLRNGGGSAGVYLFTNKINGDRYIGSSINLVSRLKNGYFGKLPIIGQRKIEVSIREYGLSNFNLNVFIIPREEVSGLSDPSVGIKYKKTLQNLVLSLEQMLILELKWWFSPGKGIGKYVKNLHRRFSPCPCPYISTDLVSGRRFYSSNSRDNNNSSSNSNYKPVFVFANADTDKEKILKAVKDKSGVYMWINKSDGKRYVGSSGNLNRRLLEYYSVKWLIRHNEISPSKIYRSLIKKGYSYFSLEILEFCEKSAIFLREQYYLDLLKPEYNILKFAGSSIGFEHSYETKAKLGIIGRSPQNLEH